VGIGEARVQRRRLLELRLDLVQVGGLLLAALPLPQSQGVIVVRLGVRGLQLNETLQSLHYLVGLRR
jgi:hypothetical protein